jgi:hypothetical protein
MSFKKRIKVVVEAANEKQAEAVGQAIENLVSKLTTDNIIMLSDLANTSDDINGAVAYVKDLLGGFNV